MRLKDNCSKCGLKHSACSLRKSIDDGMLICHVCYMKQNRVRKKAKLKVLMDEDRKREEVMANKKQMSRIDRMVKYGISLIKGEDKILETKTERLKVLMR